MDAGIERNERGPAEKEDEEKDGSYRPQSNFRLWVTDLRRRRFGEDDCGAHAAFSAGEGPVSRAKTSDAGPSSFGRPCSMTSSRSATSRIPRRCAMTITVARRARAWAIADT